MIIEQFINEKTTQMAKRPNQLRDVVLQWIKADQQSTAAFTVVDILPH